MTAARQFKCIAVSSNTNSFGLRQFYLVARNRTAYRACANSLNAPKRDEIVSVPFTVGPTSESDRYDFASLGYEIPEKLEDVPEKAINEIFKDEKPS